MSNYLGIDTGSKHIGIAKYIPETHKISYHEELNPSNLEDLYQNILFFLADPTIKKVIIEKPFFTGVTLPRAYSVIEYIGVIKLACIKSEIDIEEVSPNSVKKWFTGSGKASKDDIKNQVKLSFDLDIKSTHVNDAIAIAVSWYKKNVGCSYLHTTK